MNRDAPLVYLDHAATTPMCDAAIDAMAPYMQERFANPSGSYRSARAARRALDDARDEFAELVGCKGEEVVFTSGGTEADNLAVYGAVRARSGRVIVSAAEHKAVLLPALECDALEAPVDARCVIDLDALSELIDENCVLVSVMAVNNEVGVVQPIGDVATLVREKAPQALLHCDAVQAFCFLDAASVTAPCDLVSYSAHKFAGPKGIGALVVRAAATRHLRPNHLGGSQEHGLRAGTENVGGAIAMVAAARSWSKQKDELLERIVALRDRLADGIQLILPTAIETAPRATRVVGNCHMRIPGIEAEELLMTLDELGVCASAGSACASGAIEPSHVLLAMGISPQQAKQAVRFSLGWTTTAEDVDRALSTIAVASERLGGSHFL